MIMIYNKINNTIKPVNLGNIQYNNKQFDDRYILLPRGNIYNKKTDSIIERQQYDLVCKDGNSISISRKKLYRLVYNCEWYDDDNILFRNYEWKVSPINDKYLVCYELGIVKDCSKCKARIIQNKPDKGYIRFKINGNRWSIHRFVYFSYNYNLYKELTNKGINIQKLSIHHIDGCRINNALNNLFLCLDQQTHTNISILQEKIDTKQIKMIG